MAKSFLLDPQAARDRLRKRFELRRREWLTDQGTWPLRLPLGLPPEREAMVHLSRVRDWQGRWSDWPGPGTVVWTERRWPVLGRQRLPEALVLEGPEAVAAFIGERARWERATSRLREVTRRWPALRDTIPGTLDVFTDWEDADFERLVTLVGWLAEHPHSRLYPRQLPVPGLDSKWLETRRKAVGAWLRPLLGAADGEDLDALAGLRSPPRTLRMRLLDPALRDRLGGLGDIQAPVEEIATLRLPIRRMFIVENLQTGLAFEDMEGAALFMGQGYTVDPFGTIPWLKDLPCHYWGDLDTHGFAILDRLRIHLPHARSLLMDEDTLMAHRPFWGHEARPAAATELPRLDTGERAVFEGLKTNRWGTGVRLEQERIDWRYALRRIREAAGIGLESS